MIWLRELVQSEWLWSAILLPLGYGIFRFVEYLLKRRFEGKPEVEKIEQYMKLADLQERLKSKGISIDDLNALRAKAFAKSTESVIDVAEQYAGVAKRLTINQKIEIDDYSGEVFGSDEPLTQADMNLLSSRKAHEADEELCRLVEMITAGLDAASAQNLQKSQEWWKKLRDSEANREAQASAGGSISPLLYNTKYEAVTRERIALLQVEENSKDGSISGSRYKSAPENIFDLIEPGVPAEKVKNILGIADYIYKSEWIYRYKEIQLQIKFNENNVTEEMVAALCEDQIYFGSAPGDATNIPLGQLTLADVLEFSGSSPEFRWSARTQEVFVRGRTGPPGAWTDYTFGSLSVFSGSGRLHDVSFEWDQKEEKLAVDPKNVLINWMALPKGGSEAPYFYWFLK